ncbi:hypothetical protein H4582DRAFT_2094510 [Lactarius indigo]|nr:hypothetical protein H4582DRAFT_2094510 [Lactarius indigo]
MSHFHTKEPCSIPVDATQRRPRTLILCFDGTSDQYDKDSTNVVKLYSLFNKDHTDQQLCYYQAGVGTYTTSRFITPVVQWMAKTIDKAIAWYLYQHVLDGYRFLMQNYNAGDRVCLFGFSRGAHTARALAGMLHKVGLLSKDNTEQIPFAYQLYSSSKDPGQAKLLKDFKRMFCRNVPIDFVGVWDTVASTGIIMDETQPFAGVNTTIRVFRHALALDEHRVKFIPDYYHHGSENLDLSNYKKQVSDVPGNMSKVIPRLTDTVFEKPDVKEVWFVGCHADVGGGVKKTEERALSDIPLRWMIREIVNAGVEVIFDEKALDFLHIPVSMITKSQPTNNSPEPQRPETNSTLINRKKGNGHGDQSSPNDKPDTKDVKDVKEKINDQLAGCFLWNPWNLLEYFPITFTSIDENGKSVTGRSFHRRRGRQIPPPNPDQKTYFHESVRERMKQGYVPRAEYKESEVAYVY